MAGLCPQTQPDDRGASINPSRPKNAQCLAYFSTAPNCFLFASATERCGRSAVTGRRSAARWPPRRSRVYGAVGALGRAALRNWPARSARGVRSLRNTRRRGTRRNRRWPPRLVRVRNRSKVRHHGPEPRRLKVTPSGHAEGRGPIHAACDPYCSPQISPQIKSKVHRRFACDTIVEMQSEARG
jgi:hypothetical protein